MEQELERILNDAIAELKANNDRLEKVVGVLVAQPEVLVSNNEASRLLGLAPQTVSVMLRQGRLHKTTIGPSTGIRLSEIRSITNPQ